MRDSFEILMRGILLMAIVVSVAIAMTTLCLVLIWLCTTYGWYAFVPMLFVGFLCVAFIVGSATEKHP